MEIHKQPLIVKNLGTSNPDNIASGKITDVACTLCARDYKGLQNWGSNAVLVKELNDER